MNNKKSASIYDLGVIVEKMLTMESGQENIESIQDLRLKLASLWFDHAAKMKCLKNRKSKTYRQYAVEEEMILAAIVIFRRQSRV